jgi:hypothetical protein
MQSTLRRRIKTRALVIIWSFVEFLLSQDVVLLFVCFLGDFLRDYVERIKNHPVPILYQLPYHRGQHTTWLSAICAFTQFAEFGDLFSKITIWQILVTGPVAAPHTI